MPPSEIPPPPSSTSNESPKPDPSIAILMAALAASRADPFERFLSSLPPQLAADARETIRMREELISNVQRMLVSQDPSEAGVYAAWITKHAHEVGYRWACLRKAATRWAELDVEGFQFRIGEGGPYR